LASSASAVNQEWVILMQTLVLERMAGSSARNPAQSLAAIQR